LLLIMRVNLVFHRSERSRVSLAQTRAICRMWLGAEIGQFALLPDSQGWMHARRVPRREFFSELYEVIALSFSRSLSLALSRSSSLSPPSREKRRAVALIEELANLIKKPRPGRPAHIITLIQTRGVSPAHFFSRFLISGDLPDTRLSHLESLPYPFHFPRSFGMPRKQHFGCRVLIAVTFVTLILFIDDI